MEAEAAYEKTPVMMFLNYLPFQIFQSLLHETTICLLYQDVSGKPNFFKYGVSYGVLTAFFACLKAFFRQIPNTKIKFLKNWRKESGVRLDDFVW